MKYARKTKTQLIMPPKYHLTTKVRVYNAIGLRQVLFIFCNIAFSAIPPSLLIFNLLNADFNMQLLALTRNEEVFFRFENQEITEENITGT